LQNPLKYSTIMQEFARDKSLHRIARIEKLEFPYVLDNGPKFNFGGFYNDFDFTVSLEQKDKVLNISASATLIHSEDFGPRITWDPVSLNYDYSVLGRHLKSQIKEVLDSSFGELKPNYHLRIPVQDF
jgi:hypothetical protein